MSSTRPTPIADDLLARLAGSADIYPQKLDLGRSLVLFIELDAGTYRAASFLDDRILTPGTRGAWLRLGQVVAAAERIANPRPVHFIFHSGHVGSTLVSRLLDDTGVVLSLREPLPLRSLAEANDAGDARFDPALGTFMRLWSRGYASTHSCIVKATSTAGRVAVPVLERHAEARAIYLNLRADTYLATLLAGENSAIDLRGHGPGRMRRLRARCGAPLGTVDELSPGELAGLGWLIESWSQLEALHRCAGRVLAVDFDQLLAAIGETMGRIARHFSLPVDSEYVAEVERSPAIGRYSKAPEHEYTPRVRAEVLADSRRRNQEEIRRGIAWLEAMAKADPAVAAVVNEAGL
jgi:hypothetical protein